MRRNNLYMIIGILIFVVIYISQRYTAGNLAVKYSTRNALLSLATLADVLLTPISWTGIIFFVIGINGLKKIDVPQKRDTILRDKEKTVLRYFGPVFLLTLSLGVLVRSLDTLVLILTPIFILSLSAYLFLTLKSTAIIKEYGQTKIYPITWLLLLFVPIAHIITPFIIWRKNNKILKNK